MDHVTRRQMLTTGLAGLGSLIVIGGLPAALRGSEAEPERADPPRPLLSFVQLSDLHVGFNGPKVNPESEHMLARAVAAVNALEPQPDFVVVTGDLTHTVDDAVERRARLIRVRDGLARLRAPLRHVMPGEHDAGLDQGAVFREIFGPTHFTFDHAGVHFIALDNVSDPTGALGPEQLAWLTAGLATRARDQRIIVFTHRPLFDLAKPWDWYTRDGQAAIDLLMPFAEVAVFYGHIHQEHHAMTGHIAHHAVRSPMFALPAPGSQPKKSPIPWDPAQPYAGLGWRTVVAPGAGQPLVTHDALLATG